MPYNLNCEFEIEFKVNRIRHRNNDTRWAIIKPDITKCGYKDPIPQDMTIQGMFPSIFKGDTFKAKGKFSLNQVYGYSIILQESPEMIIAQTEKTVVDFIRKRVKGLGAKTAQKIVEQIGLDCISKIEKDYKILLSIDGIKENKAKKIYDKLVAHKYFEELSTFIQAHKLENILAIRIYETFGDQSIQKISENPFSICSIDKVEFIHADTIAFNLKFAYDYKYRIINGIMDFINYKIKSFGDICTYMSELMAEFNNYLNSIGSYKGYIIDNSKIEEAVEVLVKKGYLVKEISNTNEICLYRTDFNRVENSIVENLRKLLKETKTPLCSNNDINSFIKDYETKYFVLDGKQKDAIFMALFNGFSILHGLPGTGKTQTINTIIQCLKSINKDATITLLAPTGKASRRVEELTNMEALTIHKGIGLKCGDYNELEEITSDFVITDEGSMIDAYVFEKLISHISSNTRVLLVGDYEQLPSVGAGLILRDLINSGKIPVTKLTTIFRQAQQSQIVMNSHKIIEGLTTTDKNGLTFDISKGDFYFQEENDKIKVRQRILNYFERAITVHGYKLEEVVILTPMRVGDLGTIELNRLIQSKINPPSNKPEYAIDDLNFLREGDRVMHIKNNYDLKVMNGDVGIITSIYTTDGSYRVDVDYPKKNKVVTYKEVDLDELELAYAMTIHKSQGSEFPVVIMPIYKTQMKMLTKNTIYTAWTRAKKLVICVGTKETLDKAIKSSEVIKRNSRIIEKLQSVA